MREVGMAERRVVVTGMGAVTPLGNDAGEFWEGIRAGKNGIGQITRFDTSALKSEMGAEVKNFVYFDKKEARRTDLYTQYGMTAAIEAILQSGLVSGENIDSAKLGVSCGSGIGGIMTLESEFAKAMERGANRVSALLVPMIIGNMLGGMIAIRMKAMGSCMAPVTACATGTDSIGAAYRSIRHGYLDAAIAGGSEAPFSQVCYSGFVNMTALSSRTDPNRCSTPFDKERDGFVMGEGAGILILESLEHAQSRGAVILGEIAGYGATCDAHHITMPDPEGTGAVGAMEMAIREAKIDKSEIAYINAHGTSTPYNDLFETKAIKRVFGEYAYKVPVSSTKSMIGHLLGGAGAVEAIICIKALQESFAPPTINYKVPDEELDLDYVPNAGRTVVQEYNMSNSLGFGGHNAALVFKKWKES